MPVQTSVVCECGGTPGHADESSFCAHVGPADLSRPTGGDISSPFGPVRPPLAELPPPYDFQSAVYDAVDSDAVVRPPGPATALGRAIAAEAATRRPPTPAYAADYATVRTAVHTTAQTLTAQSLILLSHRRIPAFTTGLNPLKIWLRHPPRPSPRCPATALSCKRNSRLCRYVQMLRRLPRALLLRHVLPRALPATRDAAPLLPLLLKFWVFLEKC